MAKRNKRVGGTMREITIILLLFISLAFAQKSEILELPPELKSGELPWFALDTKDDRGYYNAVINNDKLKQIISQEKSEKIVFSFFATWCVPCKEGLKQLSNKASELKSKKIFVVLVNIGEANYGKTDEWVKLTTGRQWLLGFDKFANLPQDFGLIKIGEEMSLPRTLITDSNLRPVALIGNEGSDYIKLLLEGL